MSAAFVLICLVPTFVCQVLPLTSSYPYYGGATSSNLIDEPPLQGNAWANYGSIALRGPPLAGRSCAFDHECPYGYSCILPNCYLDAFSKHIEGRKCGHTGNCPQGYQCIKMTCVADEQRKHLEARLCRYDYECPSGWKCDYWEQRGICVEEATNNHIEGRICGANYQCPSTYFCGLNAFTCYYDGSNHLEQLCLNQLTNACPNGYVCKQLTCQYLSSAAGK